LTGYAGPNSESSSLVPIVVEQYGTFVLRGGEISNCTGIFSLVSLGRTVSAGSFIYYNGVFTNNDSNLIVSQGSTYTYKLYTDDAFRP
jgi:hypothetical protein